MIEVKDTEVELREFRLRTFVALLAVVIGFGILLSRFVYLQVVRYADFHAQAEDNRIALVPVPPERGLIIDRNGQIMAENVAAFTLELTPSQIVDMEKTIDELAKIIEITPKDRRRFKRLRDEEKTLGSIALKVRLSDEEVAKLASVRHLLPGVEVKGRLFRQYPHGEAASHVLGFIGRISQEDQDKIDASATASNYAGASHIGKIGELRS